MRGQSAVAEENRLIAFLMNVRPALRAGITLDGLRQSYSSLPAQTVEYRFILARQSWAKE